MTQNRIWEWVRANKILTAILAFFSVIVLFFLFALGSSIYYSYGGSFLSSDYGGYYQESYDYGISSPLMSAPISSSSGLGGFTSRSSSPALPSFTEKSTELEIREGRVSVKSKKAEDDLEKLTEITIARDGYIESSSKRDTRTSLIISAQARIPSERFEDYINIIKDEFEVESFELFDYRIDVQRQIDELEVIMLAMDDYNRLREETIKTDSGEERVKILSSIVSEMQELARRQRELERDLGGSQKRSELATVSFTFVENVKVNLWPENLGNRFRDRINWAIDTVITTAMFLLANMVVLFVKVVEYIIYVLIIILPVMLTWKLLRRIKCKRG